MTNVTNTQSKDICKKLSAINSSQWKCLLHFIKVSQIKKEEIYWFYFFFNSVTINSSGGGGGVGVNFLQNLEDIFVLAKKLKNQKGKF